MPITKGSFEERAFQPGDQYANAGASAEGLLKDLAGQMNNPAEQGLTGKGDIGYDAGEGDQMSSDGSPRRHGAAQRQPAGNDPSTGANGPLPAGPANTPGPADTGAGKGSKIVVTYGPKGKK